MPSSLLHCVVGGGEILSFVYFIWGGWHPYAIADVWRSEDNSDAESISFLPRRVLQVRGLELAAGCPIPVSHLATGNAVVTDACHSLRMFMFPGIQLKYSGFH